MLDLRNRREKNQASTGYRIGFKQLVIEQQAQYDLQTIQYAYDALARLTDADYYPGINMAAAAFRQYDYSYDLAGNRTQRIVTVGGTPTETNTTYNAANQISSGGVTYDDAGRMTSDGTNSFDWDRADRLLTHQGITNVYNGLGQRVSQEVSSIATDYLLDVQPGLWKVLASTTQGNTTHFMHGPRGLQATEDSVGSWTWAVSDGLGSVRLQADADLVVDGVQHFAPYGVPFGEQGTFDAPFGFTGEQTDGNRQVYLRARYYNPDVGVFGSLDSVEGTLQEALSLNRYGYVVGNPANLVDPSGNVFENPFVFDPCGPPAQTGRDCSCFAPGGSRENRYYYNMCQFFSWTSSFGPTCSPSLRPDGQNPTWDWNPTTVPTFSPSDTPTYTPFPTNTTQPTDPPQPTLTPTASQNLLRLPIDNAVFTPYGCNWIQSGDPPSPLRSRDINPRGEDEEGRTIAVGGVYADVYAPVPQAEVMIVDLNAGLNGKFVALRIHSEYLPQLGPPPLK